MPRYSVDSYHVGQEVLLTRTALSKPSLVACGNNVGIVTMILPLTNELVAKFRGIEWKLRGNEVVAKTRNMAVEDVEGRGEGPTCPTEEEEGIWFWEWVHGPYNPRTKDFDGPGEGMTLFPCLDVLHHVPNGGKRPGASGFWLKLQGVKPGIFDYVLDVPVGPYHGWRGELKREIKRCSTVSAAQKKMLAHYTQSGYWAGIHYGHRALIEDLKKYLQNTT